ncbi:uncharacterized protein PAC_07645 [Phialocephala subalpina]|uniref:Nephrocystin 3-like N-terminal domain-containing protein n=1 Tax=Phialocephala subalpina TaxID=576137 RepID=A0A1L7WYA3_9HELO|nr:uncharacterized protein PAC_07645 [Phialocephala subalpina]
MVTWFGFSPSSPITLDPTKCPKVLPLLPDHDLYSLKPPVTSTWVEGEPHFRFTELNVSHQILCATPPETEPETEPEAEPEAEPRGIYFAGFLAAPLLFFWTIYKSVILTELWILLASSAPSDYNKPELNRILKVVSVFRGAYEGLRLCLEFNEQDATRLSMLQHLAAPLQDSKDCLDFLEERLRTVGFMGQHIIGTCWDRNLKLRLRRLEDAKELFELALHADQQIILGAVENYARNAAEHIQAVQTVLNSNGKRLLEHDEKASRHHKQVESFQRTMTNDIRNIDQNLVAHDRETKRRDNQISERHQEVRSGLESWRNNASATARESIEKDILKWLANTDPSTDHNAACAKRQQHTGSWFIHGQIYLHWRDAPSSFLWLNKIPGCGKTVLYSTIIREMISFCTSEPNSALAYFYFSFNDTAKQTTINFMRSVIAQFASRKPEFPATLQMLYNTYQLGEPSLDILTSALRSTLELPGNNYIIIDALDECPNQSAERRQLCATLGEISAWDLPNLHILITSRPVSDIEDSIPLFHNAVTVPIQNKQVDEDIHRYVEIQLEGNERLSRWPPQVKEEILTTLTNKAHGMFRWTFCQIDSLQKCFTIKAIRETLKSLPESLDETYARFLFGIDKKYHELAFTALSWLAFSARPLTIKELAEAVAINPDADVPFDIENRLVDPSDILRVLSGLVVIYGDGDGDESDCEEEGGGTRYDSTDSEDLEEEEDTGHEVAWMYHVNDGDVRENYTDEEDSDQEEGDSEEYDSSQCPCSICAQGENTDGDNDGEQAETSERHRENYSILKSMKLIRLAHFSVKDLRYIAHVAALEPSFCGSVWNWEQTGYDPERQEEWETRVRYLHAEFPLLSHAFECWTIYVRDCNDKTVIDLTYKCLASDPWLSIWPRYHDIRGTLIHKHERIRQELAGPLYHAASSGLPYVCTELLKIGIDPNHRSGFFNFPLIAAVANAHHETVITLLKNGVDINIKTKCGHTTLYFSVSRGYQCIAGTLLEYGADVNAQTEDSSLVVASYRGWGKLVEQLLAKGADINAKGKPY